MATRRTQYQGTITTLTSTGGNVAVDANLGPQYELELTEATTELNNPTNLTEGQDFTILIKQDATGSRSLTFGTDWVLKDGLTSGISLAADTVSILRGTSASLPNGPGLRVYYTVEHEEETTGAPANHSSTHITGGADEIDGDQLDIDFTPSNYTPDVTPGEVTNVDHLSAHLAGVDNEIATKASTTHAADHITGGSDEIDGDQLDIDFTPSNYTPDVTPGEVTSVDHLSAHLAGIDTALAEASIQTLTSTTNQVAIDASLGVQFKLNDLAEDTEIQIPTNGTDGDQLTISLENTGGQVVTFAAGWVNLGQLDVSTEAGRISVISAVARDFGAGLEWAYAVSHAEKTSGVSKIDESLTTTDATTTNIAVIETSTNDRLYFLDLSFAASDKTADEVYQQGLRVSVYRDGAGAMTVKDSAAYSVYADDLTWSTSVVTSSPNILVRVTGDATNSVDWRLQGTMTEV